MGGTAARIVAGVGTMGASEGLWQMGSAGLAGAKYAGSAGANWLDETTGAKAAREEAARKAQEMLDGQNAEVQASKDRRATEEETAGKFAADNQAARLSRSKTKGSTGGRAGTILTSPLGEVGGAAATSGRKTILGG